MKYLVMEVHKTYVIILDEKGHFYKAANLKYQVGDTIYEPFIMNEEQEQIKSTPLLTRLYKPLIMTFSLILCIGLGFNYYLDSAMASYVLSINPKLEIVINHKNKVKDIKPLNSDAEELINNYNYKNKDKLDVTEELIDLAIEKNYLSNGGKIDIKINAKDDDYTYLSNELKEKIPSIIDDTLTIRVNIKKDNIDDDDEIVIDPNDYVDVDIDDDNEIDDDYDETIVNLINISKNDALNIVLNHISLNVNDLEDLEIEYEDDDNNYEIEFNYQEYEYTYFINADNGNIINIEKDD